jgi:hypothetical protein
MLIWQKNMTTMDYAYFWVTEHLYGHNVLHDIWHASASP